MFCCNCGKELPDESLLCPECGAKQEPQQSEEVPINEESPVYEEEASGYREETPNCEEAPQYGPDFKPCERCGAIIPIDSRFCPECRARQSDAVPMAKNGNAPKSAISLRISGLFHKLITPKMREAYQKNKKVVSALAGGALLICLILILVFSLMKPSINLNDYLIVYAEGFNGYGEAQISFDFASFCEDNGKHFSAVNSRLRYPNGSYDSYADVCEDFLTDCVDWRVLSEEKLNNGDKITIQWICKDATALNKYQCKLRYKEINYTVKSLQQAKAFDPFEGVEVSFSDVAPDGKAELYANPVSPAAKGLSYSLDNRDRLSNGDTITITVNGYDDRRALYNIEEYGVTPSSLTKEITVSGLNSYVTQTAQISEDVLKELKQQAEDVHSARIAKYEYTGDTRTGIEYLGSYLMVNKNQRAFNGDYNQLYLVYKVQMKNEYSSGVEKFNKLSDIYWYIQFNNAEVTADGVTIIDILDYSTPSDTVTVNTGVIDGTTEMNWTYPGYATLDELYRDVVAVKLEQYACESTVNAG